MAEQIAEGCGPRNAEDWIDQTARLDDAGFREAWLELLHRAGTAVTDANVDRLRAARGELGRLSDRLVGEELHGAQWPVFGALLVNLRSVLDALDAVAQAQPVEVPAPSISRARARRPAASAHAPQHPGQR
jgi:hypothetical protein